MLFVMSYPMVESLRLPERLPRAAKEFVRLPRSIALPTLQNGAQVVIGHRPQHRVNVIWHHHPGLQVIPLPVKETEGTDHEVGDLRTSEPALPLALVQVSFQLTKVVPFNFFQDIRTRRCGTVLLRASRVCMKSCQAFCPFRLNFKQHLFRKRIRQPESDEVAGSFPLYVRQIPARVNSRHQWLALRRLHACSPQFKPDAVDPWIPLSRKHGRKLRLNPFVTQQVSSTRPQTLPSLTRRGSADFQSAVSPTCSRLAADYSGDLSSSGRIAESNSAILQIENLRYEQSLRYYQKWFHERNSANSFALPVDRYE